MGLVVFPALRGHVLGRAHVLKTDAHRIWIGRLEAANESARRRRRRLASGARVAFNFVGHVLRIPLLTPAEDPAEEPAKVAEENRVSGCRPLLQHAILLSHLAAARGEIADRLAAVCRQCGRGIVAPGVTQAFANVTPGAYEHRLRHLGAVAPLDRRHQRPTRGEKVVITPMVVRAVLGTLSAASARHLFQSTERGEVEGCTVLGALAAREQARRARRGASSSFKTASDMTVIRVRHLHTEGGVRLVLFVDEAQTLQCSPANE